MGDIIFLLPRTAYMHRQYEDLLESILVSAGFSDEGPVEINEFGFQKFAGDDSVFRIFGGNTEAVPPPLPPIDGKLAIYMEEDKGEYVCLKLACFGIYFATLANVGDKLLYQFSIDRLHLPYLSKICPHGVRPSKRVVEEQSYFKYLGRGGGHGMDLADWLTAEWEAEERITGLLNSLGEA